MTQFIKLDTGMPNHPKISGLSHAAFRLAVELWCYCHAANNDGVLTTRELNRLGSHRARTELLDSGLITNENGTVSVHDYLDHQQSKADRLTLSEKRRKVGAAGGRAKAEQAKRRAEHDKQDPQHGYQIASENPSKLPSKILAEVEVEEEKKTRETMGARPVRNARALANTAHTPTAHRVTSAYAERCTRRPPSSILTAVAIQIDALITDGWTDETLLARILDTWTLKGLHAKLIPSVAHEVANSDPGRAKAASAGKHPTDAAIEQLLGYDPFTSRLTPADLRLIEGGTA